MSIDISGDSFTFSSLFIEIQDQKLLEIEMLLHLIKSPIAIHFGNLFTFEVANIQILMALPYSGGYCAMRRQGFSIPVSECERPPFPALFSDKHRIELS